MPDFSPKTTLKQGFLADWCCSGSFVLSLFNMASQLTLPSLLLEIILVYIQLCFAKVSNYSDNKDKASGCRICFSCLAFFNVWNVSFSCHCLRPYFNYRWRLFWSVWSRIKLVFLVTRDNSNVNRIKMKRSRLSTWSVLRPKQTGSCEKVPVQLYAHCWAARSCKLGRPF